MSSASTLNLPYLKSVFVAPDFTAGVGFNYLIENNTTIPIGNYLVWIYLYIKGDTDTDLGAVTTALANDSLYLNTYNAGGSIINDGILTFQNSQIVIITTEQSTINLQGSILFNNNAPTVSGSIFFLPI